jgi:hypothetical protein
VTYSIILSCFLFREKREIMRERDRKRGKRTVREKGIERDRGIKRK